MRTRHLYGICTASARHLHGICTASARRLYGVYTASARRPAASAPAPRAPRARRAPPAPRRSSPRSSTRAASPAAGGGRPRTPLTSQLPHLAPQSYPGQSYPGRDRRWSATPSSLCIQAATARIQAATLGIQRATCVSSLPTMRLSPRAPGCNPCTQAATYVSTHGAPSRRRQRDRR